MLYARRWQQMLKRKYGSHIAWRMVDKAEGVYDKAWMKYGPELNPENRKILRTRILPVYAIHRTLLDEGEERQKVLGEVDSLMRDTFFGPMLRGIRMLNLLPDPFPIVRPALRWMTKDDYKPGAQEVIEDSRDCFALNVYRCYTFDTLTSLNASELAPLFCATDDWLSEALPRVRWQRTKTLGRGDEVCDFRWCRRSKDLGN